MSLAPAFSAEAEWDVQQTFNLEMPPRDVAVSLNGRRIYVLTEKGQILIYSPGGQLEDTIEVGEHVDRISAGPREELLLLTSKKNKTIQLLTIDFIQQINVTGSPFKGAKDAPVVIAVFSEFQ